MPNQKCLTLEMPFYSYVDLFMLMPYTLLKGMFTKYSVEHMNSSNI